MEFTWGRIKSSELHVATYFPPLDEEGVGWGWLATIPPAPALPHVGGGD